MKLFQVDAFAENLFEGNPAGVCLLEKQIDRDLMQKIAMEMNLSETAFLLKKERGYDLRWFTPESEVDLCGHATLASAHILWEEGFLENNEEAVFYTKSGVLKAFKDKDYIILDFPLEPAEAAELTEELKKALKVPVIFTGKNRMDYLIEVENEESVKNLKPDFEILKKVNARGIIVTSASSNPEYDFVSRFFAPAVGINEDPVTGSAHCCLGPYWKEKLNKDNLIAYQASKRGGKLKLKVLNDRILIGGKAITFFRTEILK
ncbi:PhzF family phenazine biosynthesis protein [Thermovenabulum gondwanense]|uniref:Putative isomerase YddE n=1 Tax=Thermovenabulum gondwanense TaxID=520767 RepID=A0A161PTZ4_9FIRM|nr:PhzF family phenazine biosynthesis protein [Thermovenabulum gondwanense]KYO65501.1 putative isomerase YddE [Thermovenabulum gondwanense]